MKSLRDAQGLVESQRCGRRAYCSRRGISIAGPHRPACQSVVPGHHEFRGPGGRSRRTSDHGPGTRARHQLLRHCQRLWRDGPADGGDHRPVVDPGRSPSGTDGHRDKGLRGSRFVAEHQQVVGSTHPRVVRAQPAADADGLHRPLPDAPRRPRHSVGRNLAGDGAPGAAGQGPLRRQQQLRRLAHRQGQ